MSRSLPRIACSEVSLRMELEAAWDLCRRSGVDGVEIAGSADDLRSRQAELERAVDGGVVVSSVCAGPPFLGRQGPETIEEATRKAEDTLEIAASIKAAGVVMPVATFPSIGSGAPRALDGYLVDALVRLALHAEQLGVGLFLEPLNRYEDGSVRRLEDATALCEGVGVPSLAVAGDLFHMNIEERDPVEAIRRAGRHLRHLHVADSNRLQPGAGHLAFGPLVRAVRGIGFDGWLTLECELHGPAERALEQALDTLRRAWAEPSPTAAVGAAACERTVKGRS